MRALNSRSFGAIRIHPDAARPIPMKYDELLDEIARAELWLADPPALASPADRVAKRVRLAVLQHARTAWDQHVSESALSESDLTPGCDVVGVVEV